jgi:hypothetical protein
MIKFLQELAVVSAKNAKIFAKIFGENMYIKTHNNGPWSPCLDANRIVTSLKPNKDLENFWIVYFGLF